jgi:hypothetical protein
MSSPEPLYRVLRVLEYTGTREAVDKALEQRQVKGTAPIGWNSGALRIREAVLGDVAELLPPSAPGAAVLLQEIVSLFGEDVRQTRELREMLQQARVIPRSPNP